MRVLHLDGGTEWRGGQKQVFLLHRGLLAAGGDSHVVCASGGPLFEAIERELGEVTPWSFRRGPWFAPRGLQEILDRLQPDILHYHDSRAANFARVGSAAKIHTRRVSYPIKWFSRVTKYRPIDLHVGVSETITRDLRRHFARCATVHSSIDLDLYRSARPEGHLRGGAGYDILFVGAYSPQKGIDILLDAFAHLVGSGTDARLHLCGSGPLEAEVTARIAQLGMGDHVEQYGHQADIAPWYQDADVVVVPSVDGEGSSGTIKEGIASLKPVIASDIAPNRELVRDRENGFLFPSGDAAALAELLAARPVVEREALERARNSYGAENMVEAYRELYAALLARG